MKKTILFIVLFSNLICQAFAENKQKMDSLKVELIKASEDSNRVKIYELLCRECDVENNLLWFHLMGLTDQVVSNRHIGFPFLRQVSVVSVSFGFDCGANIGTADRLRDYRRFFR